MLFQLTKRIRDAVIINLREAFKTDTTYPYIETGDGDIDLEKTKVIIADVTPNSSVVIPTMVISTVPIEEKRFLQQDLMDEVDLGGGNFEDVRGAMLYADVNMELWTLDGINRDQLIDRVYRHFKMFTTKLAENGVEVIKTSLLPERRSFIEDRWWYIGGIRTYVYAEFREVEPKVSITGINVSLPVVET